MKKKNYLLTQLLKEESGLTLIEIMIVVAILALLGGFIGTKVIRKFDEAKVSTTKIQMRELGLVLDDFRGRCGFYPTTEQGLMALVTAPQGRECKNYDPEGFIKKVPKDAWNNEFEYTSNGDKYTLKSFGADGVPGGEGFNKDLSTDDPDF